MIGKMTCVQLKAELKFLLRISEEKGAEQKNEENRFKRIQNHLPLSILSVSSVRLGNIRDVKMLAHQAINIWFQ